MPTHPTRRLGRALLAALALWAGFLPPATAAYPDKPIRFIIPSAPGGSPDVIMRLVLNQMSQQMGQPIVVENKPGASYFIGTADIVRAAPDGYTLGYGNIVSLAINRGLFSKIPYDVDRDLTLVTNLVSVSNLLVVNNNLPVRNVQELIDYARRNPGRLSMASAGNGTTGHLGGELFKAMTGTFMLHIPYRGSAQAINDLVGGEVQVMFDNTPSIGPHVKAGKVRALGVSSAKRAGEFPDVPPIGDTVKGYETTAWGGIIGPANLPREVVARLVAEARRALASPNVREALRKLEAEPDGGTPEQFVELVRRETPKWADVIRRSGAKVD